jgi:hypothetical protein
MLIRVAENGQDNSTFFCQIEGLDLHKVLCFSCDVDDVSAITEDTVEAGVDMWVGLRSSKLNFSRFWRINFYLH